MEKILVFITVILTLCAAEVATKTDTIMVHLNSHTLSLSKKYVIPESIILDSLSGKLISDSLIINSLTGTLSNFQCEKPGKITVSFQYFDINIDENRILNPYPEIYSPEIEKRKKDTLQQNLHYQGDLDFLKSGSIYRGVTLGSESGVSLQSGLNLELKGNISDDITITGALSDQNIPIQPEGNTQTLNEIDKVYIQLGMANEDIIFGDYNLTMGKGNYGKYNRKLQGIYGESNRGIAHTKVGGAVSKGQYTSNKFNGSEGNQGPYQLTGKEGETAIIVLAGTEKVWIDGASLTRGENHDYVIDYSTGEITFTANQLITSDSRITVDFQYSNLIYQKNIWYSESEVKLFREKLKVSAEFIKESDDKENPIEIEFTEKDKKLLKNIGDDLDRSYQSTVQKDTNGVYVIEDSILVYVGPQAGTHSAVFYNVGEAGQYRKIYQANSFYFQYVDKLDETVPESQKEEALYLPAKPVKLPADQRLYHVSAEFRPNSRLTIFTEYAQSDFDMNTFSALDDGDNTGHAYNVDLQWQTLKTAIGNFTVRTALNTENKHFNPIDRNHEIEYARKWDMNSDSTQGSQAFETELAYRLDNHVAINLSGASLSQDKFNSNRYKLSGKFSYKVLESSEFYEEKIISMTNREWLRRKGSARFRLGDFTPYSTIYYEKKNNSVSLFSDFQFLEQIYGLESNNQGKVKWRVEQNFRSDESKDSSGWIDQSNAKNLKISTQITDWKTLSAKFTFANRQKKYADSQNIPDVNFSIFNLDIQQTPREFPLSWDANMKVEKERSVKKEELYYYVGEGEGQYRYDSTYAEYVPHANGAYLLRIIPSPIKIPVTNIENGLRLRYSGYRMKHPLLKRFSLITQIRLQQEIKNNNNVLSQWTWAPAKKDTSQSFFYRIVTNDLNYRIPSKKINLRLRYRTSIRKSQLDVRGAENNYIDEYTGEYRGPFAGKVRVNSEFTVKHTERVSYINSLRNRDIRSLLTKTRFSRVFNRKHHIDFLLTLSQDTQQEESSDLNAFLTGLRLEYEIKILKQGRWKIFSEFNNVSTRPDDKIIPWEMCQGNQVGNTFALGASTEYKIGRHISLRGNYESRSEPYLGLYHKGTVEVRAMF